MNIDKAIAVIFIDLKKTFGTFDHGILQATMQNYDINGIEHDWFRSYLNNCNQFCNVNDLFSKIQAIKLEYHKAHALGLSFSTIYQ